MQRDGDDVIVDLTSRLGSIGGGQELSVTGEQLRRAFAGKPEVADEPPRRERAFSDQYPSKTLFVHAKLAPEHDPVAASCSRTAGDYYYDPVDAWAELDLPEGASWADVVAAHRTLAMLHHPDRHIDGSDYERQAAEEAMSRINVAYSVLRRMTGN